MTSNAVRPGPASRTAASAPIPAIAQVVYRDTPLVERLASIPGIDLVLALRYTGGRTSLLVRALTQLVATYRHGMPTLLDASGVEAEVLERWQNAAHEARGALCTLGASTLVRTLDLFQRELGAGAACARLSPIGLELHQQMLALIERIEAELEG